MPEWEIKNLAKILVLAATWLRAEQCIYTEQQLPHAGWLEIPEKWPWDMCKCLICEMFSVFMVNSVNMDLLESQGSAAMVTFLVGLMHPKFPCAPGSSAYKQLSAGMIWHLEWWVCIIQIKKSYCSFPFQPGWCPAAILSWDLGEPGKGCAGTHWCLYCESTY